MPGSDSLLSIDVGTVTSGISTSCSTMYHLSNTNMTFHYCETLHKVRANAHVRVRGIAVSAKVPKFYPNKNTKPLDKKKIMGCKLS